MVEDLQSRANDYEGTFDTLYGLDVQEVGDGVVRAVVPVGKSVKQPFGIVHGGVYCSIAESLASIGTWMGVKDEGNVAMGLANQTSFIRPVTEGQINAEAKVIHRGRTTWIWDVEMTDSEGRPCAVSRMTIAVRPAR